MKGYRRIAALLAGVPAGLLAGGQALAHPHVFAEARMEVVGNAAGQLAAVRNVWRMDELFSSTVFVDFDKNASGALEPEELSEVGETVRESIAEWSYYTFVRVGGRLVKMQAPETIRTLYENGQLLMFFEMKAGEPIDLRSQPVTFSTFDDTFFVAFDYASEASFALVDTPSGCTKSFVVPDEDEAASTWMESIAALGPDEAVPDTGTDYAQLLATRLELKCA